MVFLCLLLSPACSREKQDPQAIFDKANLSFIHGDLVGAQKQAHYGTERFSTSPEWACRFSLFEAYVLLSQGLTRDALPLLTLNSPKACDTGDLFIQKQMLLGLANARLRHFSEAEANLNQAERLSHASQSRLNGEIARIRGSKSLEQNDLPQADIFFRNSLQIARQLKDQFLESTALLNLGVVSLREEYYDQSIDWSNAALTTAQSLDARLISEKALGNLAFAYYKMGDFEKSLSLSLEAQKNASALGSIGDQIRWSNNVGLIYFEKNEFSVAEDYYRQSLELAKKTGDAEQETNALAFLAFVSLETGKLDLARNYNNQAQEIARNRKDDLSLPYTFLVQGRIAAALGKSKEAEALFQPIATNSSNDISLRWQAFDDLARLYKDQGKIDAADKHYRQALATVECARSSFRHEEFRLPFLANATRVYDDYIHFLVEQGKPLAALQVADYGRAQTLAEGLGAREGKKCGLQLDATINFATAARKAGGTVLFYWLGHEQPMLWFITKDRTIPIKLPAVEEIDTLVQRYRKALLDAPDVLQTKNQDGIRLYEILVEPVRKFIPDDSRVTIIADGVLNNLNFETLLAPGPNLHYWIEDVTLTNASSLRMLAATRTSPQLKTGKLLLIGDPVVPDAKFPPLPSAQVEIQNVEKHFSPANREVFSDIAATPDAFLKNKPESFSYLHFVAHGTASQLSPLDSAVILSKATAEEDSYKLHARDIIGHPLHAELAVISTCYGSGTTVYNGEGLVGLSWAFLRAGAHNVVGALWAVSDTSTPKLMDQLYAELAKGRHPQDALRAAKLSLLHSEGAFRKPIYWAPFQLYTGS